MDIDNLINKGNDHLLDSIKSQEKAATAFNQTRKLLKKGEKSLDPIIDFLLLSSDGGGYAMWLYNYINRIQKELRQNLGLLMLDIYRNSQFRLALIHGTTLNFNSDEGIIEFSNRNKFIYLSGVIKYPKKLDKNISIQLFSEKEPREVNKLPLVLIGKTEIDAWLEQNPEKLSLEQFTVMVALLNKK